MSSRRLEDVFSVTIFHLPRRLQDVLQDVFNTSSQDVLEDEKLIRWRSVEDVLKTSLENVLKTKNCYAEDVLKTCWGHVLKTSSKRIEDQQMFAGYIPDLRACKH